MSGFTNVTGFAPPPASPASWACCRPRRSAACPFKVIAARVKKGRRWAIHEYPYVDGGWPEDMGRALRTYSFSGYLIGDLAPVMQQPARHGDRGQGARPADRIRRSAR